MNRDVFLDTLPRYITATCAVIIVYLLAHLVPVSPDKPVPPPKPDETVSIGHAYGATLAHTYGDAWLKAADDVDAGKTINQAQADLQATWASSRTAAFSAGVTPTFIAIIPEGSEGDATSRPKWSKSARDLAAGLKGVK